MQCRDNTIDFKGISESLGGILEAATSAETPAVCYLFYLQK